MKLLPLQGVVRETVAKVDVFIPLALYHGIGLADGIGLFVEFLPINFDERIFVKFCRFFDSGGQHPTRACRRIVQLCHKGGVTNFLHVRVKEDRHHEPNYLAGREMLTGCFIGHLRETANQILENISHLIIAHSFRRKVNIVHKFLNDQIQQIRLVQTVNLSVYIKGLQYRAGIFRKALDIVNQIVPNQHGIIGQGA